jgi:hypothetical protein
MRPRFGGAAALFRGALRSCAARTAMPTGLELPGVTLLASGKRG